MTVKTGTAWAGTFTTLDATGALATPSTGPAGVLYVDGVANAAEVTITGSNPYKFAVTLPSLTAGQRVDMYITATIDTIATAGIVASEQADTSILSDGVVVNSGTVTTLTNLPAITANWLTADGVKADAVTKIQNGLALEATLTAIKGAGWSTETLAAIDVLIDAIKAKTDLIPASPAPSNEYDVRMAAIQADLDNPAQYKADVSGLATAVNLATVDGKADAIKLKTDNLPSDPADQSAVEAAITAAVTSVKGADGDTLKVLSDQIDGIDASAIADAVWDEATGDHVIVGSTGETLANIDVSGVADAVWDELLARHVVEGSAGKTLLDIDPDTLADSIYDELSNIPAISLGVPANGEMDIYIADSLHVSISDLGSLADLDKLYVSFKERYDDEDSESILQLEYGQGLLYVNGETATVTDGSITIDDAVDGDITIDIVASVMDDITVKVCVYDVKIIRSAGVEVQTLHQGKARFHRAITRAIS